MSDFIEWSMSLFGMGLVIIIVIMVWGGLIALACGGLVWLVKLIKARKRDAS